MNPLFKKNVINGFTLVEILVAVLILSTVLFALLSMFSFANLGIFTSGSRSEKLYTIQEHIEMFIDEPDHLIQEQVTLNHDTKTITITGDFSTDVEGVLVTATDGSLSVVYFHTDH